MLEELIGRPWPIDSQLQITEATSSYLRGYAGWFSPSDKTIEVGEDLDHETLLHELSHAWFNRELFTDRWINEGFAEEYAAQALKKLGKPTDEVPLDPNSKYAVRLADWGNPSSATGDAAAREAYATTHRRGSCGNSPMRSASRTWPMLYAPSRTTHRRTVARRMNSAYRDDHHASARSPRGLSAIEEGSDLFEKYVTRESQASLYDTRLSSRAHYTELVAKGGEWTAPWSYAMSSARGASLPPTSA